MAKLNTLSLDRLPAVDLISAGGPVPLRAPDLGSPVLLFVRDAALAGAEGYIASLEAHLADFRDWYGRPLLVTEHAIRNGTLPCVQADPATWLTLGITDESSALIIADRWGVVYAATQACVFEELPDAESIEEWLRFLATQCPECGVIDEPGYGEWTV